MLAVNEFTISKIYDGEDGNNGISVIKVVPEYTVYTSSSSLPPNPNWSETKPSTVDATHYLWTRQRTDLSDGTHEYSSAVCDIVTSGIILNVDRNTNSITNKIWESDITTEINDWNTTNRIIDRISGTESNIDGITSTVSSIESITTSLDTRMNSAESSIIQHAGDIALKVNKNGVISSINQSAESITINANKVNIEGATLFSSNGRLSEASLNNTYAGKSDAIIKTVPCYYRYSPNQLGYDTIPIVGSSVVGEASIMSIDSSTNIGESNNVDNNWEYVMPIPKKGCYFFTCEEYTHANGNKTFSKIRPLNSQTYVSKWVASNNNTYIDGGQIYTHSITTNQLASDSIKSLNYIAGESGSPYSSAGSFLNLENGNFYTPYFGVQSSGAYIRGEIVATSLTIASDAFVDGIVTTNELNEVVNDLPYETIAHYLSSNGNEGVTIDDVNWNINMPELTSETPYLFEYYVDRYGDGLNGLQNIELSDNLVSFENHGDKSPIDSVILNIMPIQNGSGTPSSSNIRTISGLDNISLIRCGKNFLDINNFSGSKTINGVTFTIDENGVITANGTATANINYVLSKTLNNSSWKTYGKKYVITTGLDNNGSASTYFINGYIANADKSDGQYFHSQISQSGIYASSYIIDTSAYADGYFGQIYLRITSGYTCNNLKFYPMVYILFEDSEDENTYELLNQTTYNIDFSSVGTIYGGFLDIVSGELTITMGNIQSYNGETINEPWLSSMDEYVSGTTPTIGAQVVYTLDTPNIYKITPQQILMIEGVNNIYSLDVNNIDINYYDYQKVRGIYYNNTISSISSYTSDLKKRVTDNEENIQSNRLNFENELSNISDTFETTNQNILERINIINNNSEKRFDSIDKDLSDANTNIINLQGNVSNNNESIKKIQNIFNVDPNTGVSIYGVQKDNDGNLNIIKETYFNTTYNSMKFVSNDVETMVINGQTSTIEIEKAMIMNLNMGDFRWEVQSDNSLILREGVTNGNNGN